MYPDFQYLLQNLLGTPMPEWLSIFKTFGFLVALSFLGAAWTLTIELKRKEKQGLLHPTYEENEVGKPATTNELLWAAVLGFLLGYKVGGIFGNVAQIAPNPMGYIFSVEGNWIAGILGALLLGYSKYAEKKKEQLPQPEIKRVAIYPHQRIGEILMVAAIGGLIGAKVFNALETWDEFIKNPIESLLSSSGLTFYGGLIVAATSMYFYARKYKIPFKHLCDATAPGLMLAYGLGRLGCHFAGDGDWGIFNSAYISDASGALRYATSPTEYLSALQLDPTYFHNYVLPEFGSLAHVPHVFAKAPSWLPNWMYAMNYPHNVNSTGMPIANCVGNYCAVLPVGVFPTALYEFTTCIIFFFILWAMRKRLKYAWQMFGIYLILNGIERFLIEKMRVNFRYDLGFIHPSQAEIISTVLILAGIALVMFSKKKAEVIAQK
ncbi:MAG: diacylglyceryl transferase [Sphingobacteriales bacterium]|nr:MAG: diacylglyceryl transferase [Sphingobacteriales bacterium]